MASPTKRPPAGPAGPTRTPRPVGPPAGPTGPTGGGSVDAKIQALRKKRTLSSKQIMAVMVYTGWPKDPKVLATGASVVKCESANGANRGTINGGQCNTAGACGPWQIGVGGVGSGAASDHGISVECANDWLCATQEALRLYNQGGWGPWVASQSCWQNAGVIGSLENAAKGVIADVGSAASSVGGAVSDAVNAVLQPIDLLTRLFEPAFWLRVGKGILGFALILYGTAALSKALLGIDLAGPAQAFAQALSRANPASADSPAAATASPRARVSSKVTKYRTKGSKVIPNKTKVKPIDDPPF